MKEISQWVYEDSAGVRMPWYVKPCLEWLQSLDLNKKDVFEYGIGHSTEWYKSRGAYCFGVESHPDWKIDSKMHIFTQDKMTYLKSILNWQDFDIVAIDGIWRDDCAEFALSKLKKGGYLICDNWLQPEVELHWPKTEALTKHLPCEIYVQPDHPRGWKTAVWQNILY